MTFDLRLVTDLTIICKGTNSKKSFFTGLLPIKSQLKKLLQTSDCTFRNVYSVLRIYYVFRYCIFLLFFKG